MTSTISCHNGSVKQIVLGDTVGTLLKVAVDFREQNAVYFVRRGWSKGKLTEGKNENSMTQVVLTPILAQALRRWRN